MSTTHFQMFHLKKVVYTDTYKHVHLYTQNAHVPSVS